MKYIETNTIEDATYWMSLESNKSFTFEKLYKLELRKIHTINAWGDNIVDEGYWVRDDLNEWHQPFALIKGKYVKLLN